MSAAPHFLQLLILILIVVSAISVNELLPFVPAKLANNHMRDQLGQKNMSK